MILYTIMPEHCVYPQDEIAFYEQKIITYRGVAMIVKQKQNGNHEIVRILSSDPQHFLQFEPGQGITLN